MVKDTENTQTVNYKVIVFWVLIILITLLYLILFIVRFEATRVIRNYRDIAKEHLNLEGDITSKKGEYFVYFYSTKKDGKHLIDTDKSDKEKASDVAPIVFNYFNYVKREAKNHKKDAEFLRIYGYDVKNIDTDPNLQKLGVHLSDLPLLVRVSGDNKNIVNKYQDIRNISTTLSAQMEK